MAGTELSRGPLEITILGVCRHHSIATTPLRSVERRVGIAEQAVQVISARIGTSHSKAGGKSYDATVGLDQGRFERGADVIGCRHALVAVAIGQQDAEFLPTEPAEQVLRAQVLAANGYGAPQHDIA